MTLLENKRIIKKNSKTFYFASSFLSRDIKEKVLAVYAFCRLYDDSADIKLAEIPKKLEKQINHLNLNTDVLDQIKLGIDSDRNFSRYNNIHDLIKYSYRVAGCVGLIMCELMKVDNPKDRYHAIDLGIAMQITNICRDVIEDSKNGRIYIPNDMLPSDDIQANKAQVIKSVEKLIALSEKYYDSALYAIKYIPIKSRFSILLALRLYQSIGKKIKRNKKIFFSNKINTNKFEKFIILNTCIIEFIFKHVFSFNSRKHNAQLHDALKGLPFINEKI